MRATMSSMAASLLIGGSAFAGEQPEVLTWPAPMNENELVTAAYLGVATSPVDETLADQLGLAAGTGLVVDYVEPGSPAADVLNVHDVLLKINNQVLISHHQLAVLVRTNHPGDAVALDVVRKGSRIQCRATLDEKETQKLRRPSSWRPVRPGWEPPFWQSMTNMPGLRDLQGLFPHHGGSSEGRRLRSLARVLPRGDKRISVEVRGGAQQTVTVKDEDHSLTLRTHADGTEHLTAKDRDGKVIFDGPVSTDEEREEIPEAIRDAFEELRRLRPAADAPAPDRGEKERQTR